MTSALMTRLHQCAERADDARQERKDARRRRPLIRIWDGDWNLIGRVEAEISASFEWKLNETGVGKLVLPIDHYISRWVIDFHDRKGNVHITVDKDGARWGGRMKPFTVRKSTDGKKVLELTFMHDYEELKYIDLWANPFLPAVFQFPKIFILAGPARWVLKLFLFLNVLRLEGNLWRLPDDPLQPSSWFAALDMSQWNIVVKPSGFLDDDSTWTLCGARFKTWHDMSRAILEDAQLMVECRRWITGDPPPWPGAPELRNGTLVVDIVDKSYLRNSASGTSTHGWAWEGLVKTFLTFQPNYVEEYVNTVDDPNDPGEYKAPFWLGTRPQAPWVTFREGTLTGIQSSEFTHSAATAVQINTGGHSMPGVNEAFSALVQGLGDIITSNIQYQGYGIGAQGGAIDAVLRPIYSDVVLAWMSWKSILRAQSLGWSHYHEYFQTGADKAFTISALMVMRAGFLATDQQTTYRIEVVDGAPFLVGDNGQGHFWLGDRIGATILGATVGRIYVDQVNTLTLAWDRQKSAQWGITVGRDKQLERPMERAMRHIQVIASDLRDLGVF
ncbi:phage tail protein [Tsukamurella sp. NPDC003166]|uniref:Gp37-like protein n=1 Tax=Tsukamurella sp. NPDC003166 TaxID=3154444 RepID=UPI0033A266D2